MIAYVFLVFFTIVSFCFLQLWAATKSLELNGGLKTVFLGGGQTVWNDHLNLGVISMRFCYENFI